MKVKTLATAITLSLPMAFGSVYAQTTTAPETGNNRSSDGNAATTNQSPQSGTSVAPGMENSGTVTGTPRVATPEENTRSQPGVEPGAAGAMQKATPDATAPGMETQPSVAGSTEAITGWSTKDDLMGKSVVNENDEKIGDINDVVISSDGRSMYLLIGAGGFLGMGEKNVAVPFDRFDRRDDQIVLSGYSKEQLKALPEVRTER